MRILFSIFRITLSIFLLSACAAPAADSPQPASRQTIRYLALGDSYTIGASVPENERWPVQLAREIEASPQFAQPGGKTAPSIELTILARTGWTTDELWQGIEQTGVSPPYDLVSLLIGANNQFGRRPLEEYREQFRFLLGKAIEYAGNNPKHVFVVSIPDRGVTPFGTQSDPRKIAQEIDAFNAINRAEAEMVGVPYVDITPYSHQAAFNPELIASDGLHPSGKTYAGWVERILPVALEALK